jgi:hypothetical protein
MCNAFQSGVEQWGICIIQRCLGCVFAEIDNVYDMVPLWQRESGEGGADSQGQESDHCGEEMHLGNRCLVSRAL